MGEICNWLRPYWIKVKIKVKSKIKIKKSLIRPPAVNGHLMALGILKDAA